MLNIKMEKKKAQCFPLNSKIEKKNAKNRLLDARFQSARPDHVKVESSCCCFARELVSFDQRHVTRSPPIKKCI